MAIAGSGTTVAQPGATGAAGAGNLDAGNKNGAGEGGSDAGASDILAVLVEDNRKVAEAKGWKSTKELNSIFDAYRSLESKLGSVVAVPDDGADQSQWDKVHLKMGWPAKSEGYEFKLPAGLPENLPYDKDFADKFRGWAHGAHLSTKQAQSLHDGYVQNFAADIAARTKTIGESAVKATETFIKAWGPTDSAVHRQNIEAMRRAVSRPELQGLKEELMAAGQIIPDGDGFKPANGAIGLLLANYGMTLGMEDRVQSGDSGGATGGNPFDLKSPNMTEQGRLLRSDPERARALIRQAGQNPAAWSL